MRHYRPFYFYRLINLQPSAPPLALLPLVAREMRAWLSGSPHRVAVLHCKGSFLHLHPRLPLVTLVCQLGKGVLGLWLARISYLWMTT